MKSKFIGKFLLLVLLVVGGLMYMGCEDGGGGGGGGIYVTVSPESATIAVESTQLFTATCRSRMGRGSACPATLRWVSKNDSVATIESTTGLATGITPGNAEISVTIPSTTPTISSGSLTVMAAAQTLGTIAIVPTAPVAINIEGTEQFTATCKDTTNAAMTCPTLTWSSGDQSVATINSSGLATGVAAGTAMITVSAGTVTSNAATLTVNANAPTLSSIAVTPATPSITQGGTQQFTATGTYSDDSTQNITTSVTWASEAPSFATIVAGPGGTDPGLATGVAGGTATITATLEGKSATSVLTVIPTYTVGGTVNGLQTGRSVVLQNNGGDDLSVAYDAQSQGGVPFTFSTGLVNGSAYAVTVKSIAGGGQGCFMFGHESGTISSANVTNVLVDCF